MFYTYSSDKFRELYDQLAKEFPHHKFVLEDRPNNLEQLRHLIIDTRLEGAHNYFQFNVDDMLFFRKLDLSAVIR